MNANNPCQRWDRMTPDHRRAALLKDPTMRHPNYRALVDRMAHSTSDQLTAIQRSALNDILR